ncbi:putative lipopolysaccharide heptosyltransferase III [Candidatus Nitrospira bockiana]
MHNILVIKLRYIGDVLLATPVLRALREHVPHVRITMAVNRGTEDILRWNEDINEVMVIDRHGPAAELRLLLEVRRRRFDCVIDLTDGDRSALATRVSGAPIRIGFNAEQRWRGALYTTVVSAPPGCHRLERDMEALRPLGIEPKARPLVLNTGEEEEQAAQRLLAGLGLATADGRIATPLVMVHPGARYWFKAWPAERFAAVGDQLVKAYGCRVLIGGASQEQEVAAAIVRHASSAPISLAGRVSLLEFAAILKRCALFIGNDNGAMHMAAALGVPVVGLFGPSNPAEWGPRGARVEVLYKGLDCRACFHPTCGRGEENCMKQISVEEVFAAAEKLLRSAASPYTL